MTYNSVKCSMFWGGRVGQVVGLLGTRKVTGLNPPRGSVCINKHVSLNKDTEPIPTH